LMLWKVLLLLLRRPAELACVGSLVEALRVVSVVTSTAIVASVVAIAPVVVSVEADLISWLFAIYDVPYGTWDLFLRVDVHGHLVRNL
jgi:hypothetical protein